MLLMMASLLFSMTTPLAPPDVGGTQGCPNERATDVLARVDLQGTPRTCGIVLSVLGLDIPLWGDDCHPFHFLYPAHQQCKGKRSEGTYCAYQQEVAVRGERCACVRRDPSSGSGFNQWVCDCSELANVGTISDDQTLPCRFGPTSAGATAAGGQL